MSLNNVRVVVGPPPGIRTAVAPGVRGAKGDPGEQGPAGPAGATGATGPAGANGQDGAAATIAVGTVSTVGPSDPATVTNVGTSSAAVFDFEIPKGLDGTNGTNGVDGADGALWYAGASDPSSGTGENGDFYLQTGNGSTGIIGDVWEKAAGSWSLVGNIRGASGSGTGDMLAATYDPQNIAGDAFDRAKHTGTQTLSTISDAGTAAAADTGDFATATQGGKADSAVQPGDLGTMAAEDAADYTKTSGFGDAAFKDTGTGSGNVAAGNHGHDDATTSVPGFMSAADKTKLDSIASGATANTGTVTSVGLSVPTGLSISGSPITTSGTFAVTWTAGYQGYTTAEASKLSGVEANADVTDATNIGSSIHGASAKATPVDADTVPLIDSAASNALKKVTWANIKATLKTYFDSLYAATARGLPTGGTTGQVLVKTSGTNYDVEWDDQSGGGGSVSPSTSGVFPVGGWAFVTPQSGTWSGGATVAGSAITTRRWVSSAWSTGVVQAGTWKNISGGSLNPGADVGLGLREA